MPTLKAASDLERRRKLSRLAFPLGALTVIAAMSILPRFGLPLPLAHVQPSAQRGPMPEFTFPALSGSSWNLGSHRGHVVLLNFWATWCSPCREETPDLVQLAARYHTQGLDVAGICMDDSDVNTVAAFVQQYHISYPILLPPPGSPITDNISAYPTTVLIDRRGRVAVAYQGELDQAALKPALMKLLRETPDAKRPPSNGSKTRSSLFSGTSHPPASLLPQF